MDYWCVAASSEELITDQYPVFVKFFEKWCSRCLAMKKAFENAATRMAGKVVYVASCDSVEHVRGNSLPGCTVCFGH